MFPPEQEPLLYVSVFRGHLQNWFTMRVFRKIIESQCLANQWSDIDLSTQTYICGFPSVGVGFQLPNSTSLQSSGHYGLWHWTLLLVHPGGWNQIEREEKFLLTDTAFSHAPSWAWLPEAHRVIAMTTSSANSWVFSADWQWLWGKSLVKEIWRWEIGLSRKRLRLQAGSNKGVWVLGAHVDPVLITHPCSVCKSHSECAAK